MLNMVTTSANSQKPPSCLPLINVLPSQAIPLRLITFLTPLYITSPHTKSSTTSCATTVSIVKTWFIRLTKLWNIYGSDWWRPASQNQPAVGSASGNQWAMPSIIVLSTPIPKNTRLLWRKHITGLQSWKLSIQNSMYKNPQSSDIHTKHPPFKKKRIFLCCFNRIV